LRVDREATARAAFFRRAVFVCGAERLAAAPLRVAPFVAVRAEDRFRTGFLAVARPAAGRPPVFFALDRRAAAFFAPDRRTAAFFAPDRLVVALRDTRFATLPPVKVTDVNVPR
jgi:hypothetical protein